MRLTIGILAHNEGARIGGSLRSLWSQTVFDRTAHPDWRVEVCCVPNGCDDDTEAVVAREFAEAEGRLDDPRLSFRVRVVDRPGKVGAWNVLIHEAGDPESDYVLMMDADIEFGSPDVLARLVRALEDDPHAHASVDQPIKDLERDKTRGLFAGLSRGGSRMTLMLPGQLCGQLYCVRGPIVRRIRLPIGILGEDGVIGSFLLTDFFTHPDDFARIAAVRDVCHYYDAYTTFSKIFRSSKRIAASQAIALVLYDYLWANRAPGRDAADLIAENEARDPNWFRELLGRAIAEGRARSCRWPIVVSRVEQARALPFRQAIRYFPVALVHSAWTFLTTWEADRELRARRAVPW